MPAPTNSSESVQSFERGLRVITSFSGFPLSLSEVAERAQLSPAAARRYLATLTELGYLAQEGSLFRAQGKLLELSRPYLTASDPARKAQPILRWLTAETGETSTLTQLAGAEVVNVLAENTPQELAVQVNIAHHLPAYCTAMGRAMLALLPDSEIHQRLEALPRIQRTAKTRTALPELLQEIRKVSEQGYALVEEEHTNGVRTMSMALQLPQEQIIAISVPTPTAREERERYIERVSGPLQTAMTRLRKD